MTEKKLRLPTGAWLDRLPSLPTLHSTTGRDRQIEGLIGGWMYGQCFDHCINEWVHGFLDGWMNGWMRRVLDG